MTTGLIRRGTTWHIQKVIAGRMVRESCHTTDLTAAQRYLVKRMDEITQSVEGREPWAGTFADAATRYLSESTKASVEEDRRYVAGLMPFIGALPLSSVHMGTLAPYIESRQADGVKSRTINYALATVRQILNRAATEWIGPDGKPWLDRPAKIRLLPEDDTREPYPLSPQEQDRFFAELPEYLRAMALFKVNTGCREAEVCALRWEWEIDVPQLGTSVFLIPGAAVKNRQDRLVVLNDVARWIVEQQRGKSSTHVFTFNGAPVARMMGRAWRNARERVGLPEVRVHDLKHTFGRRLRSAGVGEQDRQDLLGHKSQRITAHYSQAELKTLIDAAQRACCSQGQGSDTLLILKRTRSLAVAE